MRHLENTQVEEKNPYSYHSKTDTLRYIVYSCFCAQVYDYNCVKLCIQNSYLHYLCGIIKYFHFNVFRCSYNSVLIVYYVCFYYNHNTYPEEKLENTVNLKRENITHISSTQQNMLTFWSVSSILFQCINLWLWVLNMYA